MLTCAFQTVVLSCVALFVGTVYPVRADEQPADSVEMLAHARKLEHLGAASTAPFLLQAEIKAAFDKKEIPGSYKLFWWSPNRWQESMVLGDFRRMRDGVTGGYWQLRSWDYQPPMIFDLEKLLDIRSLLEVRSGETFRKVRMRKIAEMSLPCVEIDYHSAIARELCFDAATGLLVHAESPGTTRPSSERTVFDYSEAISISTNQFPSILRLHRGKDFSIEVSVGRLQLVSEIQPPPPMSGSEQFEFWRSCQDMTPAILETTVKPQFPDALRRTHGQGTVLLYARIEADGTISHIKTLQSASPILERVAREAVEQWRYKPASCQGTPVKVETVIETQFSGE